MGRPFTEFHKIWIEQCAATEDIREHFGLKNAVDYLIDEKLFTFVMASAQDPEFAAELPAFFAEIPGLFAAGETGLRWIKLSSLLAIRTTRNGVRRSPAFLGVPIRGWTRRSRSEGARGW